MSANKGKRYRAGGIVGGDEVRRHDDRQFTGAGVVHALFCACCFVTGLLVGGAASAVLW